MPRGKGEGSIYKQKTNLWAASVELPPLDGKRRRKTIYAKSKRDLVTKLAAVQKELRERGDLPTTSPTCEQWFAYWLVEVVDKERRPKTAAGYRSVVNNQIVPGLGPKTRLDKLAAANIRQVHKRITDSGLSSTYALNAHRVMSASFEIAVREGKLGRNPAKLVSPPRKSTKQQNALSVSESLQLLEYVSKNSEHGTRWSAALLTGGRRGEMIGLEVNRVGEVLDLSWQLQRLKLTEEDGKPIVPADYEYRHLTGGLYLTRPKSSAGWRIIPLVDPLRSIIERHIEQMTPNPWGLVFTHADKPIDPDYDSRRWNETLKASGIDTRVVLHGLRHTTADLLFLAGVPEDIIMEILGHTTRAVSRGYKTRGNIERLTKAMESVSGLLNSREADPKEILEASA